jgi:polyferredoxin
VTLLASLFVERPWCKYACPYGAVLGLTNLFRVFGIRREASTCKLDGACDITCPMNINVSSKTVVRDHQCISCLECTSEAHCPVAATVTFSTGRLPKFGKKTAVQTDGAK